MSRTEKVFAWISILLQCAIVSASLIYSLSVGTSESSMRSDAALSANCGAKGVSECSKEQIEEIFSASRRLHDAQAQLLQTQVAALQNIGYALLASIVLQLLATWSLLMKVK